MFFVQAVLPKLQFRSHRRSRRRYCTNLPIRNGAWVNFTSLALLPRLTNWYRAANATHWECRSLRRPERLRSKTTPTPERLMTTVTWAEKWYSQSASTEPTWGCTACTWALSSISPAGWNSAWSCSLRLYHFQFCNDRRFFFHLDFSQLHPFGHEKHKKAESCLLFLFSAIACDVRALRIIVMVGVEKAYL